MDLSTLNSMELISGLVLASWIMANGFAVILGGPKLAGRLNKWGFKQLRNLIGGTFIWFGKQIKGS